MPVSDVGSILALTNHSPFPQWSFLSSVGNRGDKKETNLKMTYQMVMHAMEKNEEE